MPILILLVVMVTSIGGVFGRGWVWSSQPQVGAMAWAIIGVITQGWRWKRANQKWLYPTDGGPDACKWPPQTWRLWSSILDLSYSEVKTTHTFTWVGQCCCFMSLPLTRKLPVRKLTWGRKWYCGRCNSTLALVLVPSHIHVLWCAVSQIP